MRAKDACLLKQELANHLFEPTTKKPEDVQPDILVATQEGKLSNVQYLSSSL